MVQGLPTVCSLYWASAQNEVKKAAAAYQQGAEMGQAMSHGW